MSVDATIATWSLTKKQVTPTQKLLLLAYSDRAGERFECWPSNKRLEIDTGLDRHTICENKQQLIEKNLIRFTGEKKGRTNSIDVIQLLYIKPREGYVKELDDILSSVDLPTASIKNEVSSGHLPTAKQWAFAHTEPKRIEPKINNKEKINKKENSTYIETYYPKPKTKTTTRTLTIQSMHSFNPHGLPKQMIDDWIETRKTNKAALTLTAWEKLNKELSKCDDPLDAFEECVASGWKGFKAEWVNNHKKNKSHFDNESTTWAENIDKDMF